MNHYIRLLIHTHSPQTHKPVCRVKARDTFILVPCYDCHMGSSSEEFSFAHVDHGLANPATGPIYVIPMSQHDLLSPGKSLGHGAGPGGDPEPRTQEARLRNSFPEYVIRHLL